LRQIGPHLVESYPLESLRETDRSKSGQIPPEGQIWPHLLAPCTPTACRSKTNRSFPGHGDIPRQIGPTQEDKPSRDITNPSNMTVLNKSGRNIPNRLSSPKYSYPNLAVLTIQNTSDLSDSKHIDIPFHSKTAQTILTSLTLSSQVKPF